MVTDAFNTRAVLDWWLIDERSVRQHPLRAVGDAVSRFATVALDPKISPRHHEETDADKTSYSCKKLALTICDGIQYSFPIEQQIAIAVTEINRMTDFYRRLADGRLPELSGLPPNQHAVSPVPLLMREQTMSALTLLAYSLLQVRGELREDLTIGVSGPPQLNVIGGSVTPRPPYWVSKKIALKLVS